jgi:CRP-like cAMP-binding protein/Fe-S-cluster-containing dehydrogenase component
MNSASTISPRDQGEQFEFPGWEEEGLFARDLEGRLVRMDRATADDLDRDVTLTIDGRKITVKKAVPATDDVGRLRKDEKGHVVPRATTNYDAALQLFGTGSSNPIPILCHREFMDPVAVCRVCVVQIAKFKERTGRVDVERKLLPACQHRVEDTMIVDTLESPNPKARSRVQSAVKILTELLMTDHPTPCAKETQFGECELESLARRLELGAPRFERRETILPKDESSVVIAVDHNACILCDRCVRGCNSVRNNHVIGRMGKGFTSRIAFDLDAPMASSSCVACGECMVSCPTGALTHRGIVEARLPAGEKVETEELFEHSVPDIRQAFQGVARPFLRWNSQGVVRRHYRKGEVICREGEYGSTAFLIEQGSVELCIETPLEHIENRPVSGFFHGLGRFTSKLTSRGQPGRDGEGGRGFIPVDAPVSLPYSRPQATMGAGDIFGEMTCMSFYPRSATIRAAEDCTVLEMLRNFLYVMHRSPSFRRVLDRKYRERAINAHLRNVPLFSPLRDDPDRFREVVEMLRPRVSLRRCEPGEVIIRQGAPAVDCVYLVRMGFVKVTQSRAGGDSVLNYVGPGGYIGVIGLLWDLPELRDLVPSGGRTATCTALDHVELVRIAADDFRAIVDRFPAVREAMIAEARKLLESDRQALMALRQVPLGDFLDQGLMQAQSLLVLDLVKCTRCDECTKACADTHQGVTRLIREGLRFDRFLVASSCRSCLDPYCMVGCPVGSIRRQKSGEIIIEDWCIGCGLCAENCPYGNINMVKHYDQVKKAEVRKATTCDLCTSLGPNHQPSCVYACPHDAAHRMTGPDLLALVRAGTASTGDKMSAANSITTTERT